MARLNVSLTFRSEGLDLCKASFESMHTAAENAGFDIDVEVTDGVVCCDGLAVVRMEMTYGCPTSTMTLKPAASMILFVGSVMARMPASASMTWRDGWPHFYCPPNDDRDYEDDPTPSAPNELERA